MLNHFENDASHIGTRYLLHLIHGEGHQVEHLLKITHKGLGTTHILALLPNDQYVCDCCMGTNLGIPCRHYFQALSIVRNLHFILGVVRPR
jgi:predicted methyltransferase